MYIVALHLLCLHAGGYTGAEQCQSGRRTELAILRCRTRLDTHVGVAGTTCHRCHHGGYRDCEEQCRSYYD